MKLYRRVNTPMLIKTIVRVTMFGKDSLVLKVKRPQIDHTEMILRQLTFKCVINIVISALRRVESSMERIL
jgi:hypothetical protein